MRQDGEWREAFINGGIMLVETRYGYVRVLKGVTDFRIGNDTGVFYYRLTEGHLEWLIRALKNEEARRDGGKP